MTAFAGAALVAAGCGAEESASSPCALDRRAADRAEPVAAADAAPSPEQLVTQALTKARRVGSVHFRLTASFEAEAPESFLRARARSVSEDEGTLLRLAEHPLCFVLEGDRSAAGFSARVAIESSGSVERYAIRQADGRLYLRLHGQWFDFERAAGPHGRGSAQVHAFTRRAGHVNIALARWGEQVRLSAPAASRIITPAAGSELFGALLRALYLHY